MFIEEKSTEGVNKGIGAGREEARDSGRRGTVEGRVEVVEEEMGCFSKA